MKTRKNRGPSMLPLGIPTDIGSESDKAPLKDVFWERPVRYELNHLSADGEQPYMPSLNNR